MSEPTSVEKAAEYAMPMLGQPGFYRTDGRNGLTYDLPADVTVTRESHPGDYPCRYCGRTDGSATEPCPAGLEDHVEDFIGEDVSVHGCVRPKNPLMVPDEGHVHLLVKTPGGFGTQVFREGDDGSAHVVRQHKDDDFVGAPTFSPGSGTYVELNVPVVPDGPDAPARSWRSA